MVCIYVRTLIVCTVQLRIDLAIGDLKQTSAESDAV